MLLNTQLVNASLRRLGKGAATRYVAPKIVHLNIRSFNIQRLSISQYSTRKYHLFSIGKSHNYSYSKHNHENNKHDYFASYFSYSFTIIPAIGLTAYFNNIQTINNDTLPIHPNGDTFEQGLFLSSQKQFKDKVKREREEIVSRHKSKLIRYIIRLCFKIHDNLIEPIAIVLRFFELSTLFLPILLTYPMNWIGGKVTIHGTRETKGALLWFRLVRKILEICGPNFIKLGQWAASRTDILSPAFCDELSKLHSKSKGHSLIFSKEQLCKAFDEENFDVIFEEFNEKPSGVGAIAQVYIGKLSKDFLKKKQETMHFSEQTKEFFRNDNLIAIKILHPNVRNQIRRDLQIMNFFANVINSIPTMEWLSLPDEVEQFSFFMNLQLDLRIESMNLLKFKENFKISLDVKFPQTFLEITNPDVLFEEYINAFKMEDFLKIKNKMNEAELSQRISTPFVNAFLEMMITHDFVHADLHPGNVMIYFVKLNRQGTKCMSSKEESIKIIEKLNELYPLDAQGNIEDDRMTVFVEKLKDIMSVYTPQICFIDTGLVNELNEKNRTNFMALFNALVRFDGYQAGELMIERSRTPETAIDKEVFAFKVEKLVDKVKKQTFTLGTVSIGDLLQQMLNMVRQHHVKMEGDFVSIVVAILLLEGIGRQLDPNMDLFTSSLPILREYGLHKDSKKLWGSDTSRLSMLKIWIGLELRALLKLSTVQLRYLVDTDQLCPNF